MTGPKSEKVPCPWNFCFVVGSEKCACQQKNAVNGMGCTGEADQTYKAGQFLRLRQSTWKRLYIQFAELLEDSAVVKSGEA